MFAGAPRNALRSQGEVSIAYQVVGEGPCDLAFVPGIVSHVEFFHELPGYTEFLDGLSAFARGDHVSGLAVHIGARVAAAGEVLVSRTVKDLVVGSGFQFSDRGIRELKGVPDPWQLYAVVGQAK